MFFWGGFISPLSTGSGMSPYWETMNQSVSSSQHEQKSQRFSCGELCYVTKHPQVRYYNEVWAQCHSDGSVPCCTHTHTRKINGIAVIRSSTEQCRPSLPGEQSKPRLEKKKSPERICLEDVRFQFVSKHFFRPKQSAGASLTSQTGASSAS